MAVAGKAGTVQLHNGQQCMRFNEIATDGGLLAVPDLRNAFELWPAKRREVILDFTQYQDGSPTTKGDVIYLVNLSQMLNGRMPNGPMVEGDSGTTWCPTPITSPASACRS